MKIEAQFFSRLRDLAGASQTTFELPDGATAGELLGRIYAEHPRVESWDRTLLLAVDLEFVERSHALRDGDVVCVMPPVQGG